MTALGLAGISNLCQDSKVKGEAMRWYTKALGLTNAALASPIEAKRDTTLLATMLLSMFEATSNERTLSGWSNHVQGSASLIRMRGNQQFSTAAGRWMYPQIASLLAMNCMGRGEPVPEFIHEMVRLVKRYTILEIDSIPDRLDLKDEYIRKCSEMGVKMCIDSDAHSVNQLNFLELGIAQARRGWAKKSDIVNTLPLEQFLQTLK